MIPYGEEKANLHLPLPRYPLFALSNLPLNQMRADFGRHFFLPLLFLGTASGQFLRPPKRNSATLEPRVGAESN